MEKYKKRLRKRITVCSIFSSILVALIVLDVSGVLKSIDFIAQNRNLTSFQMGVIIGVCFVSIVYSIRFGLALKDDKKLELMYNEEYDERKKLVRQKAGLPLLHITSSVMVLAGIVAGYFDTTVFITLVSAAMCQLLISAITKQYYFMKL